MNLNMEGSCKQANRKPQIQKLVSYLTTLKWKYLDLKKAQKLKWKNKPKTVIFVAHRSNKKSEKKIK